MCEQQFHLPSQKLVLSFWLMIFVVENPCQKQKLDRPQFLFLLGLTLLQMSINVTRLIKRTYPC